MSKYNLLVNAAAVQTAPGNTASQQIVTPPGPQNPNMPPQEQAFQLKVTGVGAIAATVQLMVSNDDGPDPSLYSWTKYGDTFSTVAGDDAVQGGVQMTGSWRNFGAYVTAISGTNAKASLTMSA